MPHASAAAGFSPKLAPFARRHNPYLPVSLGLVPASHAVDRRWGFSAARCQPRRTTNTPESQLSLRKAGSLQMARFPLVDGRDR
jgi:hypothetical protein